jgi:hypothetical protein
MVSADHRRPLRLATLINNSWSSLIMPPKSSPRCIVCSSLMVYGMALRPLLTPLLEGAGDRVGHLVLVWRTLRGAATRALLVEEENRAVRAEAAAAGLGVVGDRAGEVVDFPSGVSPRTKCSGSLSSCRKMSPVLGTITTLSGFSSVFPLADW